MSFRRSDSPRSSPISSAWVAPTRRCATTTADSFPRCWVTWTGFCLTRHARAPASSQRTAPSRLARARLTSTSAHTYRRSCSSRLLTAATPTQRPAGTSSTPRARSPSRRTRRCSTTSLKNATSNSSRPAWSLADRVSPPTAARTSTPAWKSPGGSTRTCTTWTGSSWPRLRNSPTSSGRRVLKMAPPPTALPRRPATDPILRRNTSR